MQLRILDTNNVHVASQLANCHYSFDCDSVNCTSSRLYKLLAMQLTQLHSYKHKTISHKPAGIYVIKLIFIAVYTYSHYESSKLTCKLSFENLQYTIPHLIARTCLPPYACLGRKPIGSVNDLACAIQPVSLACRCSQLY